MKIAMTVTVDKEAKEQAYEIIHYKRRESFSAWVNGKLKELVEEESSGADK